MGRATWRKKSRIWGCDGGAAVEYGVAVGVLIFDTQRKWLEAVLRSEGVRSWRALALEYFRDRQNRKDIQEHPTLHLRKSD